MQCCMAMPGGLYMTKNEEELGIPDRVRYLLATVLIGSALVIGILVPL